MAKFEQRPGLVCFRISVVNRISGDPERRLRLSQRHGAAWGMSWEESKIIGYLDHLVLTVTDVSRTVSFYTEVLGMTAQTFRGGRIALKFGAQKINVHELGHEFEPKAARPTPGSADLCFIVDVGIEDVREHLRRKGIPIEEGPAPRSGAQGEITSVYVRDPDGNLIELSTYASPRGVPEPHRV